MLLSGLFGLVGIVSAGTTIALARKFHWETWMYGPTLAILPLIYIGFAFLVNSTEAAQLELYYGLPFLLVSLISLLARNPNLIFIIAAAWLFHGAYDLLHDLLFINPGVWFWYPAFCAGFDLAMGGYLIFFAKSVGQLSPTQT